MVPFFRLITDDWFQYRTVNPHTGDQVYSTIDSLSAFWPGLQVLGGDISNAIKSHLTCEWPNGVAFRRNRTLAQTGTYGDDIQDCLRCGIHMRCRLHHFIIPFAPSSLNPLGIFTG